MYEATTHIGIPKLKDSMMLLKPQCVTNQPVTFENNINGVVIIVMISRIDLQGVLRSFVGVTMGRTILNRRLLLSL